MQDFDYIMQKCQSCNKGFIFKTLEEASDFFVKLQVKFLASHGIGIVLVCKSCQEEIR